MVCKSMLYECRRMRWRKKDKGWAADSPERGLGRGRPAAGTRSNAKAGAQREFPEIKFWMHAKYPDLGVKVWREA